MTVVVIKIIFILDSVHCNLNSLSCELSSMTVVTKKVGYVSSVSKMYTCIYSIVEVMNMPKLGI